MLAFARDWLRKNWLGLATILGCFLLVFAAVNGVARWQAEKRAVEAAKVKAAVTITDAGERASAASTEAVAGLGERDAVRTSETQENRDAILKAPNARDDAGAAGDAGLAGMCKRAVYRDSARCAGLRGPHPAAAPR